MRNLLRPSDVNHEYPESCHAGERGISDFGKYEMLLRLWRRSMTSREGQATAIPLIAGPNRIVAVQECDATEA